VGHEDTTVDEEDEEGKVTQVPAQRSEVSLQITVADRTGKVLMREQEYIGTVVVEEGAVHLDDPLQEAARVAAATFLSDIAPARVTQMVRLDDTTAAEYRDRQDRRPQVTLREAEKNLRRYLKKHRTTRSRPTTSRDRRCARRHEDASRSTTRR